MFFVFFFLLKTWARCVYCKIRPAMSTIPTGWWFPILHTQKTLWTPITLKLQTRVWTRIRVRTHTLHKFTHFETRPSWIQTLQEGSKVPRRSQQGTEGATNVEPPRVLLNRVGANPGRVSLRNRRGSRRRRAFRGWWTFCALSASTPDRDVSQSTTLCPVPSAVLAKVARLRKVVVVVVAEFGVRGVTTRAFQLFLFRKLRMLQTLECCRILHPRRTLILTRNGFRMVRCCWDTSEWLVGAERSRVT